MYIFFVKEKTTVEYSRVPNISLGLNKRVGGNLFEICYAKKKEIWEGFFCELGENKCIMKEILRIVSYTYFRDFRLVGKHAGPIIQGSLFELQS